jgi:hypothetical protein
VARIRTVKPEFFTDERMAQLSALARLLFIGLWCEADREGRLEWRPATLKWKYLPADDCDIAAVCKELVDAGRVVTYTCENKLYAVIPSFREHQHINQREQDSKIPAPPGTKRVRARASTDNAGSEPVTARGEGKGRELEGKGSNPPKSPKGDEHEKFVLFWQAYPSRGNAANPRRTASKAFTAAVKRGADPDDLVRLAPSAAPAEKHGTEFVPQAATWLNQDRWKDAPKPVAEPTTLDPAKVWGDRVRLWSTAPQEPDRRFWPEAWGPPPHKGNPNIPAAVVSEFNLDGLTQPAFLRRSA